MTTGERYTLALKYPHRVEATIMELRSDYLIAECIHRCDSSCYLQGMRNTLPLHGQRAFFYDQFAEQFLLMAEDAIPVGPGKTLDGIVTYTVK